MGTKTTTSMRAMLLLAVCAAVSMGMWGGQARAGSADATFNGLTGRLVVPCMDVGGAWYHVEMTLLDTELRFQLDLEPNAFYEVERLDNCASYNGLTGMLTIPVVLVGEAAYRIEMPLVNYDPIVFQVSGVTETEPSPSDPTAPTVSASPSGGTYSSAQSVTLTATDDTDTSPTIYYTTDGSTPTTSSTQYTGAISISETTTLKFIAVDDAGNASSVKSYVYTISSGGGAPSGETYTVPLSLPSGATKLILKKIPAGTFTMGSPDSDSDALGAEKPQHSVTISKDFYMGVYEVTNAQFAAFVEASGYTGSGVDWSDSDCPITQSGELDGDPFGSSWNQPMVEVSYEGAQAFITWLNDNSYAPSGYEFVLPTEAQWEYCCRAGRTTIYSFGDASSDLGTYAWYDSNSGSTTHDVGGKSANPWGLYDMHGNVWEWCRDWYGEGYYNSSPSTDPVNTNAGAFRVVRGGSWYSVARYCRSAGRNNNVPDGTGPNFGFRLALDSK